MMAEITALQKRMIEIATHGDAAWFETHPDNRIRIRNAVAGEFNEDFGQAPVGMSWRAIVLEAQPGMRMRQPVALPLHVENDLSDQDLFALFMQAAGPEAKDVISRLRKVNPNSVPKPANAR
jgi:hypothetical protein